MRAFINTFKNIFPIFLNHAQLFCAKRNLALGFDGPVPFLIMKTFLALKQFNLSWVAFHNLQKNPIQ